MSKVYTKTGDKGTTGLVSGTRVNKCDLRIETYGEVDELNSFIGLIASTLDKNLFSTDIKFLQVIQNDLFDLGSNLACEKDKRSTYRLPMLTEKDILSLEDKMDEYNNELPKLKNFILPGGDPSSAHIHVARTVCRRVERVLVKYSIEFEDDMPKNAIVFINRLSDYLFVLGRFVNMRVGVDEILWKPKKN